MTSLHYAAVALTIILASLGVYLNDTDEVTTVPTTVTSETSAESKDTSTEVAYTIDETDFVAAGKLIANLENSELSKDEAADLIFMREEEKLARDVYLMLGDKWGMQIFSNIASSEETHTEAIHTLLERYDLEDPAKTARGEFTNPDLQKLYTELVTEGNKSLAAALTVGATIEDLDIRDIEAAIARTDNADIQTVYENLERGSRNHLRAFNRQLIATTGAAYEPQYMSEAEFNAIIESETERGGGAGNGGNGNGAGGQGNGHGQGSGW